mgnify:CR=1 FL=1
MDLSLNCDNISISPNNSRTITVSLDGVDKNELLDNLTKEDAMEKFDLVEKEN